MRSLILAFALISSLLASDQQDLAHDTALFSFSLYGKIEPAVTNTLFSPYSIFTGLSMAYTGARGGAAEELRAALNLSMSSDTLVSALSNYNPPVHLANSMWMSKEILVLSDFRKTIEEDFRAAVQTIDFHHPKAAADKINLWVSDHTDAKIPNLLSPKDLSKATHLVLANAIYYKGSWQIPFNPKKTTLGAFWTNTDTCLDVQMMEQTSSFSYSEDDQCQMIALSLTSEESSKMALVILLPKPHQEPILSFENWNRWLDQMSLTKIHLKLPKFILNERLDLNHVLASMGLKTTFSPAADFSGIDGKRDLYLSKVIHQAYIAVDEAGITAAAATEVAINMTSALPAPNPPIEFIADRPFLFFLVDLDQKIPLFMGKLINPPCS
jgi:serine protease inhibitor